MRTKGRLLIFLGEIAIFHEVFSDEIAVGRGFSECDALSAGAHLAILEHHRCRVEAKFVGDKRPELGARGVNARCRAVRAPLSARSRGYRKPGVAEPDIDPAERHPEHFRRGLRDDCRSAEHTSELQSLMRSSYAV